MVANFEQLLREEDETEEDVSNLSEASDADIDTMSEHMTPYDIHYLRQDRLLSSLHAHKMQEHQGTMASNKLRVPTIKPPPLIKPTPVWVKMDTPH